MFMSLSGVNTQSAPTQLEDMRYGGVAAALCTSRHRQVVDVTGSECERCLHYVACDLWGIKQRTESANKLTETVSWILRIINNDCVDCEEKISDHAHTLSGQFIV